MMRKLFVGALGAVSGGLALQVVAPHLLDPVGRVVYGIAIVALWTAGWKTSFGRWNV